jgi:hypothetical protein
MKCPRAPHLSTASNPTLNSHSLCTKHCPIEKLWPPPQSTVARPNRTAPAPTNAVVRIPSVPSSSRCSHGEKPSPESPASHLQRAHHPVVAVSPLWTGRNFGPWVHEPGPSLMYSHLPYFPHIAAMLYCSEDEESFDGDFF